VSAIVQGRLVENTITEAGVMEQPMLSKQEKAEAGA
jgi:hypothetical protein